MPVNCNECDLKVRMASILLGCIADDFTGATDLANNLVRAGMRVIQTIGVPTDVLAHDVDAVVVSLKSRTIEPDDAVKQSLEALRWLQRHAAKQIYFKYCSTFDSTREGNIGPVIDALMAELETDFTVATPAFPDVGRTIYQGYLFVGDVLLNESGMQDHPLTPMTDANLLRVLQPQTKHRVGLVNYLHSGKSDEAIAERFHALRHQGVAIAVVDALRNDDLIRLARAVKELPLVTAGSGLAIGLPANFGIEPNVQATELPKAEGKRAIISGSCSRATQGQVAHFIECGGKAIHVDVMALAQAPEQFELLKQQVMQACMEDTVLVYSTAAPQQLAQIQAKLGTMAVGEQVEQWLAQIAQCLVTAGVGQLIVAGGETSGAVVQALGMDALRIGQQVDPGVPWCHGVARLGGQTHPLHVSLKSGNFGGQDFFTRAFEVLS